MRCTHERKPPMHIVVAQHLAPEVWDSVYNLKDCMNVLLVTIFHRQASTADRSLLANGIVGRSCSEWKCMQAMCFVTILLYPEYCAHTPF